MDILRITERLKDSKKKALKRAAQHGLPIVVAEIKDGEEWMVHEYLDGKKEYIKKIG